MFENLVLCVCVVVGGAALLACAQGRSHSAALCHLWVCRAPKPALHPDHAARPLHEHSPGMRNATSSATYTTRV